MLLPCTQERRQTVVAAHQPPGRVPESALSLGPWRLLRRSRAPASSAPRLEGPPAGAAASAGAGGACNPPLFAGAPCACPARKAPPAPVWVRLVPVTVRIGVSTRPRAQVGSLVCRPGSTFPPVLCALQKGHKPTAFCDLRGPFAIGAALSTHMQHQSHTSVSRQVTVHTASLWLPSSAWP